MNIEEAELGKELIMLLPTPLLPLNMKIDLDSDILYLQTCY